MFFCFQSCLADILLLKKRRIHPTDSKNCLHIFLNVISRFIRLRVLSILLKHVFAGISIQDAENLQLLRLLQMVKIVFSSFGNEISPLDEFMLVFMTLHWETWLMFSWNAWDGELSNFSPEKCKRDLATQVTLLHCGPSERLFVYTDSSNQV